MRESESIVHVPLGGRRKSARMLGRDCPGMMVMKMRCHDEIRLESDEGCCCDEGRCGGESDYDPSFCLCDVLEVVRE